MVPTIQSCNDQSSSALSHLWDAVNAQPPAPTAVDGIVEDLIEDDFSESLTDGEMLGSSRGQ